MSKMTMEECQKIYGKHQEAHKESWHTWGDTQKLSREQVGMIAYFCMVEPMTHLLRALNQVGAIAETKEAKPTFLPIKRHVRWWDLEDGCVLRYCGHESGDYSYHEGEGMLVLGELYTVKRGAYGITIPYSKESSNGASEGSWGWGPTNECWEFVSNPNFVHGLDKRKTYYLKDQEKYGGHYKGAIKVLYTYHASRPSKAATSPSNRYVFSDKHCFFPVEDLTTELPKKNYNPEGYPALTAETAQVGAVIRYVGWKEHHGSCPRYGYETTVDRVMPNPHTIVYRCEMDKGGVVEAQQWSEFSDGEWVLVKPAPKPDVTITAAEYERLKALDVPKEDMTDPKNWKVGDIILRKADYWGTTLDKGVEYTINSKSSDGVQVKGYEYFGRSHHAYDGFTWVRRP